MSHETQYFADPFFGITTLLFAYSSHVAQQSRRVSVEQGNDFPGSWIFLIIAIMFGIALCILSLYCLFTPQAIAFKFTLVPSAPNWVGLLAFTAMVVFMFVAFITPLRHVIHGI